MGKVRRLRQKYHASLIKEKTEKASEGQNTTNNAPQLVPHVQRGAACDEKDR